MDVFTAVIIGLTIAAAAICGGIIGFKLGEESMECEMICRPTRWKVEDPNLGYESEWSENQYVITDLDGDMYEINCN